MNEVERYQGCLLGGAIADALAKPAQFRDPDELAARYGRITDFARSDDYLYWLLPEQWSDDTHLVLIFANSIAAKGRLDMADVVERLQAWRRGGDVRGIDMDVDNAIDMTLHGWAWQQTGREGERAGRNNPAVRATPIGLLHAAAVETPEGVEPLLADAADSARFSHNHPDAIAGAQAVAYATARLAAGLPTHDLIAATIAVLAEGKITATLQRAADLLAQGTPPATALLELGTGGYAWETVGSAFYCFLHDATDFEAAVVNAVMGGNDADTLASIVGSFSGAHNGLQAIPDRWRREVEDGERIMKLAARLYEVGQ